MGDRRLDVGIDLGTSNSSVALAEGGEVRPVRNLDDQDITPSVVHLGAGGAPTVGAAARELLDRDRASCAFEFKRRMGSGERFEFPAAGLSLLPEEVAAHLLRSLLADVRMAAGTEPTRAVVTVPAMFEIRQCEATRRAAALAGLRESPLLQEPIAAGIAYGFDRKGADGFLLVYDLGGGTFDLTLLSADGGRIRILDNDGDNFLGGRDLDGKILDWCLPQLAERCGLPELSRGDPRFAPLFTAVRLAAEKAKRALSQRPAARLSVGPVDVPGVDRPISFDAELSRETYEALIEPVLGRTFGICRRLLDANRLRPRDVRALIPIGAPTVTPLVRRLLADRLGVAIAQGVDPKLTVARGAALYAATLPPESSRSAPAADGPARLALELVHEASTRLEEIPVAGRLVPIPGTQAADEPLSARIERSDGSWSSAAVPVERGVFLVEVHLSGGGRHEFRVRIADAKGGPVACRGGEFSVQADLVVDRAPLPRSVGVAYEAAPGFLYNEVLFPKGTPLPASRSVSLRSVRPIGPSSPESVLHVHLLEGESIQAAANERVGSMKIAGNRLERDVPAGAALEFVVSLDESRIPRVSCTVPSTGEHLEEVLELERDRPLLARAEEALEESIADLRRFRRELSDVARSDEVLGLFEDAASRQAECVREREAARGGDPDALLRFDHLVRRLRGTVAELELALEWPRVEARFHETAAWAARYVPTGGKSGDVEELQRLLREGEAAARVRDALLVRRRTDDIHLMAWRACKDDSGYWERWIGWASAEPRDRWTDPVAAQRILDAMARDVRAGTIGSLAKRQSDVCALLEPKAKRSGLRLEDPGLTLG